MSEGDKTLIAGRYRLENQIGSGAMGVVWRAIDIRLDRPVAVKQLLLPPGLNDTETEKARQRAAREGRIAARLQHPNAISVYNVVDHDGQPVLVMEYLPSRSLSDVLEERVTLPPQDVARIGAQVAAALTAAHGAGVIHRDVKPGNILLAEDGTAKITDFGISRAAGDVTLTSTGLLAGTPAFLSPETARGSEPGPAGDVFSLGATLYAAVEGRPPFENPGNEIAMLHVVAAGNIIPPRQAGELDAPLRSMLQSEPHTRPTMAQVEETLRAVAEGRSGGADAPTLPSSPPVRGSTRVDLHPASVSAIPSVGHPAPHTPSTVPPVGGADQTVPPSSPHTPAAGFSAPSPSGDGGAGRSRARTVTTTLSVLAAAAVGVLVAELIVGGTGSSDASTESDTAGGDQTTASAPAPSETQPPVSESSTAAQPTSSSTPTQEAPSPAELEQAVADYYELLPENADQAWHHLGPSLREQGRRSYRDFWSSIGDVSIVDGPRAVGGHLVEVEIDFTVAGKGVIREVHRLGMIVQGGRVLIDTDEIMSITEIGEPDEDEEDEEDRENREDEED
ncbi:serine/threonine protein kinase [Saccharomonospora sp.]|uniref:serine/threonine-protein kinase n=1 Tax=Saccharomonospora sp. TaxID=33913 RepID=UPI00262FD83B|nr:serine/threonine protein kinase [Saccharomonospora sp.]